MVLIYEQLSTIMPDYQYYYMDLNYLEDLDKLIIVDRRFDLLIEQLKNYNKSKLDFEKAFKFENDNEM